MQLDIAAVPAADANPPLPDLLPTVYAANGELADLRHGPFVEDDQGGTVPFIL